MPQDKLKAEREAFDFLREHFREDQPFTKTDLQQQTHWSQRAISTYWSKQFEPFVKSVLPILKDKSTKNQQYRVTDLTRRAGTGVGRDRMRYPC